MRWSSETANYWKRILRKSESFPPSHRGLQPLAKKVRISVGMGMRAKVTLGLTSIEIFNRSAPTFIIIFETWFPRTGLACRLHCSADDEWRIQFPLSLDSPVSALCQC